MKLTKQEAKTIARRVAEVNTALWNAICYTEELLNDEKVKFLLNSFEEDCVEQCKMVAEAYIGLKKNDDSFVEAEANESYLNDFDSLTSRLQKYIDEIDPE